VAVAANSHVPTRGVAARQMNSVARCSATIEGRKIATQLGHLTELTV